MKSHSHSNYQRIIEQRGAVAPVVAVCMVALIAVSALAVDIAHFYVARNELQNAADAGALAGAGVLLNADGTVNANANTEAYNAATQNNSENSSVELLDYSSNSATGDVQRGHWTFAASSANSSDDSFPQGSFLTYSDTVQYNLLGKTFAFLNTDLTFVNAVKVTVRRTAAFPVVTFLAGIFGVNSVVMERTAVAYRGLAGSAGPEEVDEPVIICIESIVDENGAYQCNIGRMINSGNNIVVHNTAGWSNYEQHQSSACSGGASASSIRSVISCTPGTNPVLLKYNWYLESNGGQVTSAYDDLYNCWLAACDTMLADGVTPGQDGLPDIPWTLRLPVVECGDSNNVGNCNRYLGMVEVELMLMTPSGNNPKLNSMPVHMAAAGDNGPWTAPYPNAGPKDVALRQANFDNFITHYNLKNVDDQTASYQQKAMYFIPTCSTGLGEGGNGGYNFGVRAKYPVLVNYAQP